MINTMEMFSGLGDIKIEGVDIIANKYKTIVDSTKKKNYNLLDHRKGDVSFDLLVDSPCFCIIHEYAVIISFKCCLFSSSEYAQVFVCLFIFSS